MTKKKLNLTIKYALYICLILSPILIMIISLSLNNLKLTELIPGFNDETGYFIQLRNFCFGGNQGYFGYNGNHAKVLGWNAHSFLNFIPYYPFVKIIGMKNYIMPLCNIIFLMIALLVFVLLIKPKTLTTLFILFATVSSPFILRYMILSMLEILNFSYTIIIASLLFYLINKKESKYYKSILITSWILIVYTCFCRITYTLYLIPINLITLKNKKLKWKIIITTLVTALGFILVKLFNYLFTAEYILGYSFFEVLINNGIIYLIKNIISNLLVPMFDFYSLICSSYIYFLIYFINIIIFIYLCIKIKKKSFDKKFFNLAFCFLISFIYFSAICALYVFASISSLSRVNYVILIFDIFYLTMCIDEFGINFKGALKFIYKINFNFLIFVFIISSFIFGFSSTRTMQFAYYSDYDKIVYDINGVNQNIYPKLKYGDTRWENTIVFIYPTKHDVLVLMDLPAGFSISYTIVNSDGSSYYSDNCTTFLPKYVFIDKSTSEELLTIYLDSHFEILANFEDYYLLLNTIYDY